MTLTETHAAALAAYPLDSLTGPDIPAAVYLYEADQLSSLLGDPAIGPVVTKLVARPDLGAELAARIATFREAQQQWWLGSSRRKPEEQAADEAGLAGDVQEALAQLEWWGRKDHALQAVISKLREGQGVADLLADGDDTAALLERNAGLFPAGGFDPAASASALRDRTARVRAGQVDFSNDRSRAQLVETRNRAFAWCDELVDEIRAAGRFAFRKDKALAARFASAYIRRRNARARAAVSPAPSET